LLCIGLQGITGLLGFRGGAAPANQGKRSRRGEKHSDNQSHNCLLRWQNFRDTKLPHGAGNLSVIWASCNRTQAMRNGKKRDWGQMEAESIALDTMRDGDREAVARLIFDSTNHYYAQRLSA